MTRVQRLPQRKSRVMNPAFSVFAFKFIQVGSARIFLRVSGAC
jgi:hypothetical protein